MMLHVALLRGVNVGGRTRLAMSELKALAARLSLDAPRTLLQSGNLVFGSEGASVAELERLLEAETLRQLNLRTEFHVRTAAEWAAILAANPFPREAAGDPAHVLMMAFKSPPRPEGLEALQAAYRGPERIALAGREAYVVFPEGIGRSKLTPVLLGRHLGAGTGRNWNTVLRIAGMLDG